MNEFGPTGPSPTALLLLKVADSPDLLEVGRKAIENCLVEYRNARISEIRSNGLVIREPDGTPSSIIRFGPEHALRIGILAIVQCLCETQPEVRK